MDQNVLVSSGHALVSAMDATSFSPRLAMWVHNTDTDTWKLWLVPPVGKNNKAEFYRHVAQLISTQRTKLGNIDSSDVEMVLDTHPAVKGLSKFIRVAGLGSAHFSGNRFNGYYLPDGIILRSNL
jgi:hypothetical protein